MSTSYFITAIGTDSGKSIVSAIFVEALKADYWKPIQAGYPRDTEMVKNLVSNPTSTFHQEKYCLNEPMSPHAAAKIDNIHIQIQDFELPQTTKPLIVEGAGGLLVPINDDTFVIDLIKQLNIPLVLVANLYLGSINHTLLSIEAIKNRKLPVKGIVFNGKSNPASEQIIEKYSGWEILLRIEQEEYIDKSKIQYYAHRLRSTF